MDVCWKIFNNIKFICNGYIHWVWFSFIQTLNAINSGYFMYLLKTYYPNNRPFGEYELVKQQKKEENVKQQTDDNELNEKQQFAHYIHNQINITLSQYISKNRNKKFSPKEFQDEVGLSLGIRSDIECVHIKKILKIGQNTVRVSVEVQPTGWEKDAKLAFNFDFKGIDDF